MQIVALTGQPSCGKGMVVKVLKEEFGFEVETLSSILRVLIIADGLEVTRERLQAMGDKVRAESGPGILVQLLVNQAIEKGVEKLAIDGLRSKGEVEELKNVGGVLVGIETKMEDLLGWYLKRGREDDQVSEERFWQLIDRENKGVEAGEMNIAACIEMAEIKINNFGSEEELLEKARGLGPKLEDREGKLGGKEH